MRLIPIIVSQDRVQIIMGRRNEQDQNKQGPESAKRLFLKHVRLEARNDDGV